ncbi:MAG: phosphate-binding protein [Deltaproteobacteria bacterium]|nr:MAG: phosphate-binding protein [Deltaproteobacteria bacterium]
MKKLLVATLALASTVALAIPATSLAAREMVQIKGSDTLINLVQSWSEAYLDKTGKMISVTGGGSGTGIAALIDGRCDIADASREMKSKEYKMAEERGIKVSEITVAIDGLSVIVNADNPIQELKFEDIGEPFKGEIKNWKGVGGDEGAVTLYGRQSNSGTFAFFQELLLEKKDYSDKMNRMNGNAQIVEAVRKDKNAVGYVGIGYILDEKGNVVPGIKAVKVVKDGKSVSPLNAAAVKGGDYPLSRGLYQYIAGTPSKLAVDFIRFELSDEGQKMAEKMGFYPISEALMKKNLEALK